MSLKKKFMDGGQRPVTKARLEPMAPVSLNVSKVTGVVKLASSCLYTFHNVHLAIWDSNTVFPYNVRLYFHITYGKYQDSTEDYENLSGV